jgi:hypothetical protein
MKGSPALAVAGGCRVAAGLRKLSQDRSRRLGSAHCDQSLKFLLKIRDENLKFLLRLAGQTVDLYQGKQKVVRYSGIELGAENSLGNTKDTLTKNWNKEALAR